MADERALLVRTRMQEELRSRSAPFPQVSEKHVRRVAALAEKALAEERKREKEEKKALRAQEEEHRRSTKEANRKREQERQKRKLLREQKKCEEEGIRKEESEVKTDSCEDSDDKKEEVAVSPERTSEVSGDECEKTDTKTTATTTFFRIYTDDEKEETKQEEEKTGDATQIALRRAAELKAQMDDVKARAKAMAPPATAPKAAAAKRQSRPFISSSSDSSMDEDEAGERAHRPVAASGTSRSPSPTAKHARAAEAEADLTTTEPKDHRPMWASVTLASGKRQAEDVTTTEPKDHRPMVASVTLASVKRQAENVTTKEPKDHRPMLASVTLASVKRQEEKVSRATQEAKQALEAYMQLKEPGFEEGAVHVQRELREEKGEVEDQKARDHRPSMASVTSEGVQRALREEKGEVEDQKARDHRPSMASVTSEGVAGTTSMAPPRKATPPSTSATSKAPSQVRFGGGLWPSRPFISSSSSSSDSSAPSSRAPSEAPETTIGDAANDDRRAHRPMSASVTSEVQIQERQKVAEGSGMKAHRPIAASVTSVQEKDPRRQGASLGSRGGEQVQAPQQQAKSGAAQKHADKDKAKRGHRPVKASVTSESSVDDYGAEGSQTLGGVGDFGISKATSRKGDDYRAEGSQTHVGVGDFGIRKAISRTCDDYGAEGSQTHVGVGDFGISKRPKGEDQQRVAVMAATATAPGATKVKRQEEKVEEGAVHVQREQREEKGEVEDQKTRDHRPSMASVTSEGGAGTTSKAPPHKASTMLTASASTIAPRAHRPKCESVTSASASMRFLRPAGDGSTASLAVSPAGLYVTRMTDEEYFQRLLSRRLDNKFAKLDEGPASSASKPLLLTPRPDRHSDGSRPQPTLLIPRAEVQPRKAEEEDKRKKDEDEEEEYEGTEEEDEEGMDEPMIKKRGRRQRKALFRKRKAEEQWQQEQVPPWGSGR
jgi:hypothetical protein